MTYWEVGSGIPPSYRAVEVARLKKAAPHIGHKQHLCNMCESGDCSLEQIKTLVKDPKFICKVCVRAAAVEENLCEPVSL